MYYKCGMKKFITKKRKWEHIDTITGEVINIETDEQYKQVIKYSKFYMMYKDNRIYELERGADIKVFLALCDMAVYDTGEVFMNVKQRKTLAKRAKVSYANLYKNLARLVERGFIFLEEGTYYINPEIAWTGNVKMRAELIDNVNFMRKFNKPIQEDEETTPPDFSSLQDRINKAEV